MRANRTITLLSKGISLLCHPVIMTLWATIIVVYCNATSVKFVPTLKPFVVWSVAGMTVVVPTLFWALLHCLSHRNRVQRSPSRTKVMMLFACGLSILGCGAVFAKFMMLFVVRKVLYTAAVVVAMLLIMEFIWPLDHYSVSIGALLGIEWTLLYVGNVGLLYPFIGTIVVAGLLCSARHIVGRLSAPHIYAGAAGGLIVGLTTFILL